MAADVMPLPWPFLRLLLLARSLIAAWPFIFGLGVWCPNRGHSFVAKVAAWI